MEWSEVCPRWRRIYGVRLVRSNYYSVMSEHRPGLDPRRDDERRYPNPVSPKRLRRDLRGSGWRHMIVEPAVLIVNDDQQSFLPLWTSHHGLHYSTHQILPFLDIGRGTIAVAVRRQFDKVRIDE